MARDIRGNPWKFDGTGQGEGMANSGSWLRLGTFTAAATDIVTMAAHGLQTGSPVRVRVLLKILTTGLAELMPTRSSYTPHMRQHWLLEQR
jgi:hypothetical protein